MQITLNLSGLHPATRQSLCNGLQHEDRARHALGVLEQLRLKKLIDHAAVPGFNTNIGRTSMCMSPDQVQRAKEIYGERCFADPAFGKFLVKQHPEFGVKDVGTRIQSGWTPATGKKQTSR